MTKWKPKEIIIHKAVKDDFVTTYFLKQCPDVPTKYVEKGTAKIVVEASDILNHAGSKMLDKIIAGKQVVFIAPATNAVDVFTMPDDRMICPHFDRLKLASNGCFYQCDWCYLKLTYRAAFPFITIRAQYKKIKSQIQRRLSQTNDPVIFNSGELADSLSMDHLTQAGREFIPWFGKKKNGYLFMLTKSDNIGEILALPHNEHTVVAWSMNNETVSEKFEIGAPSFEKRLEAARKVQKAGYPVRIRIDPVVPFHGWQEAYSDTIKKIFQKISPERITVGTLRFEAGFYNMRDSLIATEDGFKQYLKEMVPMFPPKRFSGLSKPKAGKYSFTEEKRVEIFGYIINEIRKYSGCPIALCKESASVWNNLNLPLSKCRCVCQLDYADMAG